MHSDVAAVTNVIDDAFLRAMDGVVISRVETVLRSIGGSLGHAPNSVVQNLEEKCFRDYG